MHTLGEDEVVFLCAATVFFRLTNSSISCLRFTADLSDRLPGFFPFPFAEGSCSAGSDEVSVGSRSLLLLLVILKIFIVFLVCE